MKNDCMCATAADLCVTHPRYNSKGSSGPSAMQWRALNAAAKGFGHLHPTAAQMQSSLMGSFCLKEALW